MSKFIKRFEIRHKRSKLNDSYYAGENSDIADIRTKNYFAVFLLLKLSNINLLYPSATCHLRNFTIESIQGRKTQTHWRISFKLNLTPVLLWVAY
jgi:hypothetical protein